MSVSDFCIKRPVFAAVLSMLIVVLGIASLLRLPIRELPDVDSAIISVNTSYTGAAPEIVDTDITAPIEGTIAGIAGVKTISSTSQRGGARTVIEFEPGRNIEEAANDVRDAVARVRTKLPTEVDEPRITKNDSNSDPVMRIAITSDRLSPAEITDFVERFLVDRLATLDGVAQVQMYGERRYAIRIWLDRRAMAARNLTVDDVESALERNNVELPAGELKSTLRQFTVRSDTRLSTPKQFENIVLERIDGYPVRLGDIARVVRGAAGRPDAGPLGRARGGGRSRAPAVAGQHDRDLEPRARPARSDPPDLALRAWTSRSARTMRSSSTSRSTRCCARSGSRSCWSCW